MKEIKLTQGQIALVDNEDFKRVNQFKWCASWELHTKSFYAVRNLSRNDGPRKLISMARFIMDCPDTMEVDHSNHSTLDNRKQNLRICTSYENNRNRRKRDDCLSKYKGVYLNRKTKTWYTQIRLRDIFDQTFLRSLGSFKDEVEAALAYDKAAKKEFGEFACLNFKGRKDSDKT